MRRAPHKRENEKEESIEEDVRTKERRGGESSSLSTAVAGRVGMGSEERRKEIGKNKMFNLHLSKDNAGVKYITVTEILTDLQASDQTDSLSPMTI